MEGLVSRRKLLPILAYAEQAGVDVAELSRRAGIDPGGGDWFTQWSWAALWRELSAMTGDPNVGLEAAAKIERGYYGVIDYAIRSCRDVGEALACAVRYFRLANSAGELVVQEEDERVVVERRITGDEAGALPPQAAEFALASMLRTIRLGARDRIDLAWVELRHPSPPSDARHREAFGCEVRFGAMRDAIVVHRRVLAIEMRDPDPHLLEIVSARADAALDELGGAPSLVADLRRILHRDLGAADVGLETAARRLKMSGRTLQRRLRELDTSYREVLDDLRRDLAKRYLSSGLDVVEVAFLLGYQDASTFHRAFKTWTGTTPGDFRDR